MRRRLAVLSLLLAALAAPAYAGHGSGASLPATCTLGDTFNLLPLTSTYDCRATNIWVPRETVHPVARPLADNTLTTVWSVALPTSNTACSVHMSFSYTATGGGNTVSHAGIAIAALTNNAGTVSGTVTDSGSAVNGTGCVAGCDTWAISAVGTTATLNATFNNTLSVTGGLTYRVLNNSCGTLTEF
jgi:hypothetical protein